MLYLSTNEVVVHFVNLKSLQKLLHDPFVEWSNRLYILGKQYFFVCFNIQHANIL
jgi:hypothetical protein